MMREKTTLDQILDLYNRLGSCGKRIFFEVLEEYIEGSTFDEAITMIAKRRGFDPRDFKGIVMIDATN